jgi:hypothetical protein
MMEEGSIFSEDYFERGPEKGLSNYVLYRWLPEVTLPCAYRIMDYVGARHGELVLDLGCAKGFYVKAYRMMGFEGYGHDISRWALDNCHPDVKRFVSTEFPKFYPDWVIAKDTFEHIPEDRLNVICERLYRQTLKGLLVIVPLTAETGGKYVRDEDEMDVTHVIRWTLLDWMRFLEKHFPKFTLSAAYHVPGIKAASEQVPRSTGFFRLTK